VAVIDIDDKIWDVDEIINQSLTQKDLRQFDRMDAESLIVTKL